MVDNHYQVNWDLLRLGVIGKNSIDSSNLSGSLAIHVVGAYVTFYLTKLHADGLYLMTELSRVQCPMSIMEVPAYLTSFSRLKNIIHTFENLCKPGNDNDDISHWRRGSLTSADISFVLHEKRDRKRKNTAGHYPSKQKICSLVCFYGWSRWKLNSL